MGSREERLNSLLGRSRIAEKHQLEFLAELSEKHRKEEALSSGERAHNKLRKNKRHLDLEDTK